MQSGGKERATRSVTVIPAAAKSQHFARRHITIRLP